MSRRYQPLNARHAATIAEHARSMRHSPSASEQRLWAELSASKLGVSFKRQYVVGTFIADFAAPSAKVIIEVDGGYHSLRAATDAARDRKLQRMGWRVLHLPTELVLGSLPTAVSAVRSALSIQPG